MCREQGSLPHTFGAETREINQGPLVKSKKVNLLMFLQIPLSVISVHYFKLQVIQNVKRALSEGCANKVCEHP